MYPTRSVIEGAEVGGVENKDGTAEGRLGSDRHGWRAGASKEALVWIGIASLYGTGYCATRLPSREALGAALVRESPLWGWLAKQVVVLGVMAACVLTASVAGVLLFAGTNARRGARDSDPMERGSGSG